MKKATSIDGKEFDLDKLGSFDYWTAEDAVITLWNINQERIVDVNVSTLISCWIEKEKQDYNDVFVEKGEEDE